MPRARLRRHPRSVHRRSRAQPAHHPPVWSALLTSHCAVSAVLELDGAKLRVVAEVRTARPALLCAIRVQLSHPPLPPSAVWRAQSEKPNGLKCSTFAASSFEQRHLATGDYSGFVQTWNVERLDVPAFSVKGHDSIINAIDGCGGLNVGYGAPEIVTGSRDGRVKVWDVRQTEAVVSAATNMRWASAAQRRQCPELTCPPLPSGAPRVGRAGARLGPDRSRLLGRGVRQRVQRHRANCRGRVSTPDSAHHPPCRRSPSTANPSASPPLLCPSATTTGT